MSKFAVVVLVLALFVSGAFTRTLKEETSQDVNAFDGSLERFNIFNPLNHEVHRWCRHCGVSDCEANGKTCSQIGRHCEFQIIEYEGNYKEGCCTCHN